MVDDFACTDCVQHGARRVGGGTQGNGPGSTAGLSGPGNGANGVFRDKTIELGSFRPNAFGLYDMHGNVWEWVLNCYERYEGAPVDGSAVADTRNGSRVARGGSFLDEPLANVDPARHDPGQGFGSAPNRGDGAAVQLLPLVSRKAMILARSSAEAMPPYGFILCPDTTCSGLAMKRSSEALSHTRSASFIALE
jgi:hypothetical protein